MEPESIVSEPESRSWGVGASVYGVGASVYGSLVILVSALGPNPSFFLFWGILLNRGLDLDQGLTINQISKC